MQATETEFWQLMKLGYILVLIVYIYSRYFFLLLLLPSGEPDKQMFDLTAGVKQVYVDCLPQLWTEAGLRLRNSLCHADRRS